MRSMRASAARRALSRIARATAKGGSMATSSSRNDRRSRWISRGWIAAALLLAGCISMTEPDCRGADWYQLGWQDGLAGLRPMIDVYAYQCRALKVEPSETTYMKGWNEGKWEYDSRVHRSDCCPT